VQSEITQKPSPGCRLSGRGRTPEGLLGAARVWLRSFWVAAGGVDAEAFQGWLLPWPS